jgi:hypothetical protein
MKPFFRTGSVPLAAGHDRVPDAPGNRFPQWWMLLLTILTVLSGQGVQMGMERGVGDGNGDPGWRWENIEGARSMKALATQRRSLPSGAMTPTAWAKTKAWLIRGNQTLAGLCEAASTTAREKRTAFRRKDSEI